MKRIIAIIILIVTQLQITHAQKLDWVSKVGAKQFPAGQKVYKVNTVTDTSRVVTKDIQAAIDECAQKGGGIVTFSPGIYITGSIFLKTNVHLKIDKGVLLLGSQTLMITPRLIHG